MVQAGPSAGGSAMQMQVNLFISGRKLKDLDTFSKSDPQCRVYEKRGNSWTKIAETECISNNLNPDFKTSITLAYYFEKIQSLKFEMVDLDNGGSYDLIGEIEVTLGNLMGAPRQLWQKDLTVAGNNRSRGQIIVRTEAVQETN